MKRWFLVCLIVLTCSVSYAECIVQDNFNSYANGSIVGQGGWESYSNGNAFVVQSAMVFEGSNALYCESNSIIVKQGTLQLDGTQAIYVRMTNSSGGMAQVRISNGLWFNPNQSFVAIDFDVGGNVSYYDHNALVFHNFSTYNYNEWTLLETEWRSDNAMARYRINGEGWTDWSLVNYSESFVGFDYMGIESINTGAYFDTLGSPVPEPSTVALLITGLIAIYFLRRRK